MANIAPDIKALEIRTAILAARAGKAAGEDYQERESLRLVLDRDPAPVVNKRGEVVGVDAWVRLFRDGVEVPIDPHRRFINPPLQVVVSPAVYQTDADGNPILLAPRVLRRDPEAAYWEVLWQSVLGVPNAKGWRTRGTVTTVFATAPGGDGFVASNNAAYATARTGSGLLVAGDHSAGQDIGYQCREAFIIFDTSGIPDTDAVSAVVLSMDGVSDSSTTDFTMGAAASAYDGGAVLTTDFVSGASIPTPELATWASSGYVAGYNAFTETADFKSAINKAGNTSLILYSQKHRDATTPTTSEYVTFTDADAAGTTTDPKIDITHAFPPLTLAAVAGVAALTNVNVATPARMTLQSVAGIAVVTNVIPGTPRLTLQAVAGLSSLPNLTVTNPVGPLISSVTPSSFSDGATGIAIAGVRFGTGP